MTRTAVPIRARRGPRSSWLIAYAEAPGHWFTTPIPCAEGDSTTGRLPALTWAKRNRERLLAQAPSGLHLRDFCADFFVSGSPWVTRMEAKGHHFGAAYLQVRQGHLDNYIVPLFGDMDPRELSGRYLDDILIEATRRGGKALAPATKYKIYYSLNLVLEDFVERGIIAANPLAGIRTYSKAPIAPRGALPPDAIAKLFPTAHGDMVRIWGSSMWVACMLVLIDTGMRPGELRALRWRELFREVREDGVVSWGFVVRYAIEAGTKDTVKGTKNEGVKAPGIGSRTAQELRVWRAESRHAGDDDFIFTLDGVSPIASASIIKAFRRGLVEAGISGERWTPYWLRHSFATYAIGFLTEKETADLLGHSVEIDRLYQHPTDELARFRSREARGKLDKAREK